LRNAFDACALLRAEIHFLLLAIFLDPGGDPALIRHDARLGELRDFLGDVGFVKIE
jgi:hypothetical protein